MPQSKFGSLCCSLFYIWGLATNEKCVFFNYVHLNSEEIVKIIWFEVDCGQDQEAKNEICPQRCGQIILIMQINSYCIL